MTTTTDVPSSTHTPSGTSAPAGHLAAVDGLRGLAALLVLAFHLFEQSGSPEWRPWHHINLLRPMHDGWCGVNLFLVLSGFCLAWPYARAPHRPFAFREFMRRRARRILPAYYAALVLVPLLSWLAFRDWRLLNTPHGPLDVAMHLTLLHSLVASTILSQQTVYWSLGLEWIWYLVFPGALLLFRRLPVWQAVLVLAAVNAVYRTALFVFLGPGAQFRGSAVVSAITLRHFILGRVFEFGCGTCVAHIVARRRQPLPAVRAATVAAPLLLVAAHVAAVADPFLPVRDMLYGLAFGALLYAVVAPAERRYWVTAVFASPVFERIGVFSYSLYLFHLPVILIAVQMMPAGWHGRASTYLLSAVLVPPILAIAWTAHRLFERPFLVSRPPRRTEAIMSGGS